MYQVKPKEAEHTVRAWEELGVQLLKRNIEDARNGDETFRVGPLMCNDNGLQRRIGSDVVFKINVSAFKKHCVREGGTHIPVLCHRFRQL